MVGGVGGCTAVKSILVLKCDGYFMGGDETTTVFANVMTSVVPVTVVVRLPPAQDRGGLASLAIEQKRPNALRRISDRIDGVDR